MSKIVSPIIPSNPPSSRLGQWAFAFLLLAMAGQGIARMAARSIPDAVTASIDLRSPYLSSRAWGKGIDPYSRKNIAAEWDQAPPAGEPDFTENDWLWCASLYPPSTLALIYPLTFIPWAVVRIGWVIANLLLCAAGWWALIRMLNLPWSGRRSLFFAAAFISLGPLISCLRTANPTIIAVMLCVFVLYFVKLNRPFWAGIILGFAVTLKPQLAGAVLLLFVLKLRPRVFIPAVAVVALFAVIGVGRLWIAHVHWIPSLHANLALSDDPGRINDASRLNAWKWALLNLQVPLFEIFSNRILVNALAWGGVTFMCLVYLWIWKRSSRPVDEILLLSVPLALCLLPIYHRYYDALVLVFPLGWACAHFGTAKHRHALAILVCTAPFYVSSVFILDNLKDHKLVPAALTHSAFWNVALLPLETWALIAVAIIIMHRMWLDGRVWVTSQSAEPAGSGDLTWSAVIERLENRLPIAERLITGSLQVPKQRTEHQSPAWIGWFFLDPIKSSTRIGRSIGPIGLFTLYRRSRLGYKHSPARSDILIRAAGVEVRTEPGRLSIRWNRVGSRFEMSDSQQA